MEKIGERMQAIAIELTQVKSIVGTAGEVEIANKIYEKLKSLEYFKNNEDNLQLLELKGDSLGRKNVLAYIEGKKGSDRAVLCLGHIDTVGIQDYAEWKDDATNPEKLKEKLGSIKFNSETMAEIKSEDWILGRGIFDMKTGIAASLVMIEEFSKKADKMNANLIFLGVADEEGQSLGMLSGVEDLERLARDKGWHFVAAVDTDYMTGRYQEDEQKYVYIGSVGKLLPCFYIYGEETHVGEAFNGLDANLLASEILYQIDLNSDLCDIVEDEVTVPPVCLHQRDLKTEYSVQTANAVNVYFNFATHSKEPEQVLADCKAKTVIAFENVIEKLNKEYEKFCSLSKINFKKLPWQVEVLTYEELYQNVKNEIGDKIDEIINNLSRELKKKKVDDREFSLAIVQKVHNYYSDQNAKVIIYFSPPYYPHIYVKGEEEKERRLMEAVNSAVGQAKKIYDYKVAIKKFYPYISDLSYCHISRNTESISKLTDNMPAWMRNYTLPIEAIQNISMPVVNIGPYGKDAHKLSERVCKSYSFDAMPFILEKTLENLLII
jgi:arginine utilization protein RocB